MDELAPAPSRAARTPRTSLATKLGTVAIVGALAFSVAFTARTLTRHASPAAPAPVTRTITVVCHSKTEDSTPYDCAYVHGAWMPRTTRLGPVPMPVPGRAVAPISA